MPVLIGVILFAVWLWALVDAISVPDNSMYRAGDKLIWVLVILLAPLVGAIVYVLIGRPSPGGGRYGRTY